MGLDGDGLETIPDTIPDTRLFYLSEQNSLNAIQVRPENEGEPELDGEPELGVESIPNLRST
jgi:hypothetical protein